MKRFVEIAIIALIGLLVFASAALAANLDANQRTLLNRINQERRLRGSGRLNWAPKLEKAAEKHSRDMAARAYLAHRSSNGDTLPERLKKSGISSWKAAVEAVADAGSEERALNAWLSGSVGRRKLLDARYTHIGIGITAGGRNGNVYTINLAQNPKPKDRLDANSRRILNLLNSKRKEMGVKPLKWGTKMAAVGRLHSRDMLEHNYFSHKSQDGRNLVDRLRAGKVTGWSRAGENIAGTNSVDRAFELWMQSDSHRENMLDPKYTHVGVGSASSGRFTMYTMDLVAYP